jgi:putative membrane protein
METDPSQKNVSNHLANERTYLAWLRTSFALLTLGFATNKFGQFLVTTHLNANQEIPHHLLYGSRRFGLWMVIFSTILMAISSWHYQQTRKAINAGTYRATSTLIWIVAALSILFSLTAVALLLQS